MTKPTKDKISKAGKFSLKAIFTMAGLAIALMAAPAYAEGESAIDDLKTESDKLSDVVDAVQPVAISVGVFSFGMMMIKKMVFS
jgi:hypothetical protein